jgi:hypothetical protein
MTKKLTQMDGKINIDDASGSNDVFLACRLICRHYFTGVLFRKRVLQSKHEELTNQHFTFQLVVMH